MKVIVIGSGLIGLTSAYYLRRRGHEVLVLDRQEGPGRETSFANGSLLTPGLPEPWNAPGCWRDLVSSIGRADAPLKLRLAALPTLARWGVAFLRSSRAAEFERNTLKNFLLAAYSLRVMRSLREETGIEFGRIARGTLKIFRDAGALEGALAASGQLRPHGLVFVELSAAQAVELEPALAPLERKLAGAIHYPDDETGDAYRFCLALAERARAEGVEFRFGTRVTALEVRAGAWAAVLTPAERLTADRCLVAAGSYSTPLLERVGVGLPVRPAKGYSVTFDPSPAAPALRMALLDDHFHAAVVPVGSGIRAAGTAEFAGYDLTLRPERLANLIALLRAVLPEAHFDPAKGRGWCGLRPMSSDGVPIIGATPVANLFVNTGHGPLGWTMAAGSGQLLADLMCGSASGIDPAPYSLARFTGVTGAARRKA
ncbi:MAG: D-amino acid dehydrogenase [Gammaproteobacteria bacterium]|nr:D-amino acid dehydrogenase [Gammaproteobacteria bacterium]